MVIDKIREATRPIHTQLDEWLLPVFQDVNTMEKYSAILNAFYTYFDPVMKKIDEKLDTSYLPDYNERRKPNLIIDDLGAINQQVGEITPQQLPFIENASAAFGALYVLEGSTLGGVYLSSVLAKNVPSLTEKGLSFFYGYGKESKERWHNFVNHLNTFAEQAGNEEDIVNAAIDTFTCFKQHLQKTLRNETS